ncbi:hypothetical protein SSX86_007749 [Deinandra increscens subsp. villosa]|uniref:Uncharacterized protein n=1 Tax=Deinandra increscens subsp. villosa TaxID=3103831 RepID=A0AAP0H885_9ASTR
MLDAIDQTIKGPTNVKDPVARLRVQSNALRSGALLQNLGAFLLELSRTTMTLRMGQAPTDAVINAGPAIFIPTSGPNPIMVQSREKFPTLFYYLLPYLTLVQPLPFHPGTSFGTKPTGPDTSFSLGTGLRPRNIDIRIRIALGSVLSSAINHREATGGERSAVESAASDGGISNQQAAPGNLPQTGGGSDVRVVPIRISTLPPGLAPSLVIKIGAGNGAGKILLGKSSQPVYELDFSEYW